VHGCRASDLYERESGAGGQSCLVVVRRVPVVGVQLSESLPAGGPQAVDGRLAVPDGRRRRMTPSHPVLVDCTQRTRTTLSLDTHTHTHTHTHRPLYTPT